MSRKHVEKVHSLGAVGYKTPNNVSQNYANLQKEGYPAHTWRNNYVITASKRRRDVILP